MNKLIIAVVTLMAAMASWAAPLPEGLSWRGKNVVFIGDSITDKCHVGCTTNYWGFLEAELGIKAYVYGKNGWQANGIPTQVEWAKQELADRVDAVFIFMGTNDFNGGVPLGELYGYSEEKVDKNSQLVALKKREFQFDGNTFRGRLNVGLKAVKTTFPQAQVVLLTPIHRGYAKFGPGNVQPDERYANTLGLFIDDYVNAVVEAGGAWSTPVIDLYRESGFLPCLKEYDGEVHLPDADRLHPGTAGHHRLARVIAARLRALPSTFRDAK